jgi:hypothetical protein
MNRAARVGLLAALAALTTGAMASIDVDALWSFNDPAAIEVRFRAALADARDDDALVLGTQIVRTLGLRSRYDEAPAMQLALERDAAAAGEPDPYVFDELALLDAPRAAAWRAQAESVRNGRRP